MGEIQKNVITYLEKLGIKLQKSEIDLTYGKVEHINREDKKESQKLSPEQIKRINTIIAQNDVYFDSEKENIVYISKLPPEEILNNRDWIKVPVNLNDKDGNNIVATMSIIPAKDIFKNSTYKKID